MSFAVHSGSPTTTYHSQGDGPIAGWVLPSKRYSVVGVRSEGDDQRGLGPRPTGIIVAALKGGRISTAGQDPDHGIPIGTTAGGERVEAVGGCGESEELVVEEAGAAAGTV